MQLLIHADSGARSCFLAGWLTDCLTRVEFDCGKTLPIIFHQIHNLTDVNELKTFNGIKIRIRPSREYIDLLTLLFLKKNVHTKVPSFTKDEYSLETFTKLACFAQEIFQHDSTLDYSVYDHVIDFNSLFDNNLMIELYHLITGRTASSDMITVLKETNKLNQLIIDSNHACSILKLIITREHELGLKEENRYWSIVDIYNNTPVEQLYSTVYNSIKPENYSIS